MNTDKTALCYLCLSVFICGPKVFSALSLHLCLEPLPATIELSMVEAIRPGTSAPFARVAVFDFDGTVSLIRAGWVDIMIPMMLEVLRALHTNETDGDLRRAVEPF